MPRRADFPPSPSDDAAEGRIFRFENCLVRIDTREVFRDGKAQPVRSRVFDLLVFLLRRRPFIVSKAELLKHVWCRTAVSDSLLSRTVVEARRIIGDDPTRPRMLLNTRGSGYRFQGEVTSDMRIDLAVNEHEDVAAVRNHLRSAALAYELHDDHVTAQQHAELAYAAAERGRFNVERGRALVWLGWLALRGPGPLQAAQFVSEAMAVAHAEEHRVLLAQAQLADALVRLTVGDAERALHQLKGAYPLLGGQGLEGHRYRCENLLSAVHRHLGDYDTALDWVRRAQVTAQSWPNRSCLARALSNEVATLMDLGDHHGRSGDPDKARAAWTAALDVLAQAKGHPVVASLPALQTQLISHESALLGRSGQFDRALALQEAAERSFAASQSPGSHLDVDRQISLLSRRVDLLHRSGQHAAAQESIDRAIALAEANDQRHWLPELYEQGSQVAEACERWQLALQRSRQRHEAFVKLQGQRSLTLARVLELDASVDKIRRESEAALRRAEAAEASLMRLRRQLQAMELSLLKSDARASAALLDFVALHADAHHEAIRRGLPFWLLLVSNDAELDSAGRDRTLDPAGPERAALAALPRVDIGGFPTVRLDEHLVLVALGSIGRARAEQTIAHLLSLGNVSSRRRVAPEMTPVHWVDAAGFETLAAAIAAVRTPPELHTPSIEP